MIVSRSPLVCPLDSSQFFVKNRAVFFTMLITKWKPADAKCEMIRLIANKQELRPFKETRQPEMAKTKLLFFQIKGKYLSNHSTDLSLGVHCEWWIWILLLIKHRMLLCRSPNQIHSSLKFCARYREISLQITNLIWTPGGVCKFPTFMQTLKCCSGSVWRLSRILRTTRVLRWPK